MQKTMYHKVRQCSYGWLKWVFALYVFALCVCSIFYLTTGKGVFMLSIVTMAFIGVMFLVTARQLKWYKARNITRLIQKHIWKNSLYQTKIRGRRKVYILYPDAEWRIDESVNTLYIRFRLTGNKINLCGLEVTFQPLPLEFYIFQVCEER